MKIQTLTTIREIQTKIQEITKTSGIFGHSFENRNGFQWLIPYCEGVDTLLIVEDGSLKLIPSLWFHSTPTPDDMNNLIVAVRVEMLKHEYELKKLIDTLDLEYNPIHNVDEDTIEIYKGDGTNKNKRVEDGKGGTKGHSATNDITDTSYDALEENTNITVGSHTDTGSVTDKNVYGQRKSTSNGTNNIAPFDSESFLSNTQENGSVTNNEYTDNLTQTTNSTIGARNDSTVHSVNAHDDKIDRVIDTVNTTSYTNNIVANIDGTTSTSYSKHILRKGNIGVTSTQQLITQEREIARFSIYQEIVNIFINSLCIGVYNEKYSVARDIYGRGEWYDDYVL